MTEGEAPEPVEVPFSELSAELLHAVVESFVLREGTDYGEKEVALEDKVAGVIRQLQKGEAKILFDPESDSVTIAVKRSSR
jgi:uncharacterized protein YheU (UPF0270 family)